AAIAFLCAPVAASCAGRVSAFQTRDTCTLRWRGDERIEVSVTRRRGVFGAPMTVRVDNQQLALNGFYAAFNGRSEGWRSASVRTSLRAGRIIVRHLLRHKGFARP